MRLLHRFAAATLVFASLAAGECPAAPAATVDGFALPQPGHRFDFPRDHGSHPEFKIEWWYVTGPLFTGATNPDGRPPRRFGFQATFFRQAGPSGATDSNPQFGTANVFLAHMALVDVQTGRVIFKERL